jgi:hypothetical protein
VVRLERPDMTMQCWVAKRSRELLRTEIDLGQGRRMVMSL